MSHNLGNQVSGYWYHYNRCRQLFVVLLGMNILAAPSLTPFSTAMQCIVRCTTVATTEVACVLNTFPLHFLGLCWQYKSIRKKKKRSIYISLTSQQGLAPLSPYLNFDPAYLPPSQPEYIFPEGAAKQRGRFELAFSQIGAACIIGAGIGGATGLYRGIKATSLADQTGKLRRTQLINHVMKSGSSLANTFGIVSVMYSGFGVLLSWVRGTDDSLNTLAAATGTGMLFKSTTGLKKCALGGCIGLGIASVYCLWTNREALLELRHRNINPASTNKGMIEGFAFCN